MTRQKPAKEMYQKILDVMECYLKRHPGTYVNPNFLAEIITSIDDFYGRDGEDGSVVSDELHDLIQDMYSM